MSIGPLFPGWCPSVEYWNARRDGIQLSTRIVHADQWVYEHLPNRVSRSAIEPYTLEGCGFVGGTNLKIVLSTSESGHFAIAVSREQKRSVAG
jgi:hypothetical protein